MKKILSFALAVALSFSLLIGSAFASSGASSIVAPDTFISWGDSNNPYTLSVPSVALNNRNYIVYQVRDWALSYLRVRFVIDSFDADVVPVEGESVSGWIRFSGTWALGVNAALEPTYYNTSLYADDNYTYSRSFLHKPVYSNFDYYDSDGQLIISGDTSGSADDTLMDLTLNDGTVIQVPRSLQGADFVVARSSSADQYRIWLFQPDQVESGLVYEGSTEALYFTSDGSYSVGGSVVVVNNIEVDLSIFDIDFNSFPYILVYGNRYVSVRASSLPFVLRENSEGTVLVSAAAGSVVQTQNLTTSGSLTGISDYSDGYFFVYDETAFLSGEFISNFDLMSVDGTSVVLPSSFSLGSGSWSWTSWLTMSTALDITQYGDIVYQSFNYSTSTPEESPSPAPDNTPDGSNNGLFGWLREQWVFLMGRLTGVIDSINALADKLDPFPDQTTPILKNFFNVVFPNRITDSDINNIDIALDRFAGWFDTGYTFADFFDLFNEDYFLNWFTDDTRNALDTVGGAE